MRDNFNIKKFERWLKNSYGEEIANAPVNSFQPYFTEFPDGKQELIFVAKCESWLYEPLKGKTSEDTVLTNIKAYLEGDKFIWGFNIESVINYESEIPDDSIEDFLSAIINLDALTIVIVDHLTTNIVWMTNDYPLQQTLLTLRPMFKHLGIR
ncbi:hypothetical protein [Paenibacillus sp. FSL K6-2524]|uniref:hypothetical protein n=1 Tax=Paenibacillus sp. FSL K6-2524 TaxID=2954516 RepID=UPI0030F95AAC